MQKNVEDLLKMALDAEGIAIKLQIDLNAAKGSLLEIELQDKLQTARENAIRWRHDATVAIFHQLQNEA